MLIYNTTYHIDSTCYDEFVEWLRLKYIPDALQHGALTTPRIARVMAEGNEPGISVALQFDVAGLDELEAWYTACGEELVKALQTKFGRQVAGFSTLMENIDL